MYLINYYLSKIVFQQISFTLNPAHSRVGIGNLTLIQFVPRLPPNSEGIACIKYFLSSNGDRTHDQPYLHSDAWVTGKWETWCLNTSLPTLLHAGYSATLKKYIYHYHLVKYSSVVYIMKKNYVSTHIFAQDDTYCVCLIALKIKGGKPCINLS